MELFFIIYALLMFFISNGLGKLILKKESKIYPFRSLLGFCLFISTLQLGYYPMQYFQVSINFVYIWTMIVFIVSFVIGVRFFSKDDFKIFKRWEFYFLFFLVFFFVKILPINEAGDDWFYMPLIMDNVDASRINSIDPRTGWNLDIGSIWSYQGYYLLATCIYKIQSLFDTSVNAIFVSFRSTFSLLMILFSSIVLSEIPNILKIKKRSINIIIQLLSIYLVGFLEWSHIYWGSFASFTTFFPLMVFSINDYVKVPTQRKAIIIAIINGAIISLFSSALFLTAFLMYSFFTCSIFRRNVRFIDYYIMLIPSLIYLSLFVEKPYLILLVVLFFYIASKFLSTKIDLFFNKYGMYFVIAIPILIVLITPILGMKYTWSLYRLGYIYLLFNISISIFIMYEIMKKKRTIEPLLLMFVVYVITFFNPLVCPFISNYFTSDQVYYRLFYITKNPLVIAFIFKYIYVHYFKNKNAQIVYSIFISSLMCYYLLVFLQGVNFNVEFSNSYNYILREDDDELAVGSFLAIEKFDCDTLIWSDYIQPRMFNQKVKARVSRYAETDQGIEVIDQFLHSEEELPTEKFIDSKNAIHNSGVSLLITRNNSIIKERVTLISDIIYENDSYIVYKVR
ncbi:hypothetical protein EDD63_14119 [Breznakia blatticola]|uniref:Uncharacterized protein n=1 Tax=Breznakia blatticola TaxID=1754012 RepID=A0A4R7ZCX9_9FIRM|nr:hypothetical protein [Breznakia blatticola]TDW13958.1 hypothetical protein EDD63_14119 [Breznakia blatticola]